ncbi:hypothetical protein NDU88_005504 [Pleurodeles waltl]|uniref:Uncharacterized protein n=1 Tax=Pleurodeles waltl TaxID=8319 RepID=A0AAV7PNT5_PLEWA|nr:hypothetical protein NDU88_005504 [Pleurodeles waltl]
MPPVSNNPFTEISVYKQTPGWAQLTSLFDRDGHGPSLTLCGFGKSVHAYCLVGKALRPILQSPGSLTLGRLRARTWHLDGHTFEL